MFQDQNGLVVSFSDEYTIEGINAFQNELVSQGANAALIFELAEANPHCPIIQAYAACLFLFNQTESDARDAEPYMESALAQYEGLTKYEQQFIKAVKCGLKLNFMAAIECYEQMAEAEIISPVAIKLMEFHCFETGESERQLAFMEKVAKDSQNSHVRSMYAFALQLNEYFPEAEKVALKCIEIHHHTPWAFHALAHIYFNQGKTKQAIELLDRSTEVWDACNLYIQSHMAFHRAVFYFCDGRYEAGLGLFETHCWGENVDSVLQHTDALLLLWAADLVGCDTQRYYTKVAEHIKDKASQFVFPFLNAFYIYALFKAGETELVEVLLKDFHQYAMAQTGEAQRIWLMLGVPLVEGVVAFAKGDYQKATWHWELLWNENDFGGSDEQRIPLMWSYMKALYKTNQSPKADTLIEMYLKNRVPKVLLS